MRILAVVPLLAAAAGSLEAQWHVGIELGTTQHLGTTRDTAGSAIGAYVRPDHAASYGLRVGRDFGSTRVAVRAAVSRPGIAATARDVTVTDRSTGSLVEVVPLIGARVARLGPGGALHAEAGPAFDLWEIDGDTRMRVAALAAAAYEWQVAGRFTGVVRAEGAIGPSVLTAAEIPVDLEPRPTWRYGVTLGLRYRL